MIRLWTGIPCLKGYRFEYRFSGLPHRQRSLAANRDAVDSANLLNKQANGIPDAEDGSNCSNFVSGSQSTI